jgi:hypothetical protein
MLICPDTPWKSMMRIRLHNHTAYPKSLGITGGCSAEKGPELKYATYMAASTSLLHE